jgi:hypothetical protein
VILGIPDITYKPGNVIFEGLPEDHESHKRKLLALEKNEFIIGHIYYSERWQKMLEDLNMKHLFIIRDPRDVIVSLAYFICEHLPTHPLYELFQTMTKKDQYLTLINGLSNEELQYGNIVQWYDIFSGWMKDPHTLTVTFEELMISHQSRRAAIQRIATYLWSGLNPSLPLSSMMKKMEENIDPTHSPTFRKGKIGGWMDEFDDEVKEAFKRVAGDLLIELGYEKNKEW